MESFDPKNRLLLVLNPVSGKGQGKYILFDLVNELSRYGYLVTVMLTDPEGNTERQIIEKAKDYDKIVALGGDGTLNMVAGAIIKSGADVPLGYIPLGSANDFGSSLGLTNDVEDACHIIATHDPKAIDVGFCNGKYFVYIVSAGMFTSTSYTTSQQLKNVLGHNAYVIKGISELKDIKRTKYSLEIDGETISEDLIFISVSNTLHIGGMLHLEHDNVQFDDGLFEIILVKYPHSIIDGTALTNDLINSNLSTERFIRRQAKELKIRTAEPQRWTLDGENGGLHSEIDIKICPKAIKMIY